MGDGVLDYKYRGLQQVDFKLSRLDDVAAHIREQLARKNHQRDLRFLGLMLRNYAVLLTLKKSELPDPRRSQTPGKYVEAIESFIDHNMGRLVYCPDIDCDSFNSKGTPGFYFIKSTKAGNLTKKLRLWLQGSSIISVPGFPYQVLATSLAFPNEHFEYTTLTHLKNPLFFAQLCARIIEDFPTVTRAQQSIKIEGPKLCSLPSSPSPHQVPKV